ncbi:regulator of chromosome condensation 1/beta-lactamase-inhibitor protein II [Mycena pura]|uniref:Regulator of chromosome condensation 1/beta-lactamase-inhibitor protein II n=1 Tax=Mycena pura TaxID=153505 RepID=A0AAD6YMV0_9AGAR|nr:regulator of chromosome condensation 1/beta-lactamase-inhibitor protein II [Mycena pura]
MPSVESIPVELILDNLLMLMPVEDVLRLACTNKFFATLCNDELLWHRRLDTDFNFPSAATARVSGWKFIYRNLFNPKGPEKSNGRLGLGNKVPKTNLQGSGVPFPTQIKITGARIVNIVAGGMSFHALDSQGNLWVWGTLNATTGALNSEGFAEPGKMTNVPLRLELPTRIKDVSCGRLHACALDAKAQVWTFTSWGRPFTLSSAHLLRDSRPVQVECGWNFSSLLTKSGEVFVWWPLSGTMEQRIAAKNIEMNDARHFAARALPDGVIPCATWVLEADPERLPPLPRLPKLTNTGDESGDDEIKIIKIAAMDERIVALTNQGHVVLFNNLGSEDTLSSGRWTYLPNFSELDRVCALPPFSATDGIVATPQTMKITHISAHFLKFFAYSTGASSVVLMGDTDTTNESDPHIEPALQGKDVISVLVGDWHYAALTGTGRLLTWGGYSAGALGLGDPTVLPAGTPGGFAEERQRVHALEQGLGMPPNTRVPTEVRFDHARKTPKERFCFLACASGWQTGALVIDLQPNAEGEDDDEEEELVEQDAPRRRLRGLPFRSLPMQTPHVAGFPGGGIFRVGFAGRGATRGGRGRGI